MSLDFPPLPERPPYVQRETRGKGHQPIEDSPRDHCVDLGCVRRGTTEKKDQPASSSPPPAPAGVLGSLKINFAAVGSTQVRYSTEVFHRIFGAEAKTIPMTSSPWPTVEKNVLELLKNQIKKVTAAIRAAKKKLLLLDYLEHEGAEVGDTINFPEFIEDVGEQGEVPKELLILGEFIDFKNQARRGDHTKEKRRELEKEIRASERELATIMANFRGNPLILNTIIGKKAAEADRQMAAHVKWITNLLHHRMELQKKLEFVRGKEWYEISDEIRETANAFAAKLLDKKERYRNTREFEKLQRKKRKQRLKPNVEQGLRPRIGMGGHGEISDLALSMQQDRTRRRVLGRALHVFTHEDGTSKKKKAHSYRRMQRMDRDEDEDIKDPQLDPLSIAEREEREAEEMFKINCEFEYEAGRDDSIEEENEKWQIALKEADCFRILDRNNSYDQGDLPTLVELHRKYAKDIRKMSRKGRREEAMLEDECGRKAIFEQVERVMEKLAIKQLEAPLYIPTTADGEQTKPNGYRSVRKMVRQELAYVCARTRGPISWLE